MDFNVSGSVHHSVAHLVCNSASPQHAQSERGQALDLQSTVRKSTHHVRFEIERASRSLEQLDSDRVYTFSRKQETRHMSQAVSQSSTGG